MAWSKHTKGSDGVAINPNKVACTVKQTRVRQVLDGATLRQASSHVTQRETAGRN